MTQPPRNRAAGKIVQMWATLGLATATGQLRTDRRGEGPPVPDRLVVPGGWIDIAVVADDHVGRAVAPVELRHASRDHVLGGRGRVEQRRHYASLEVSVESDGDAPPGLYVGEVVGTDGVPITTIALYVDDGAPVADVSGG